MHLLVIYLLFFWQEFIWSKIQNKKLSLITKISNQIAWVNRYILKKILVFYDKLLYWNQENTIATSSLLDTSNIYTSDVWVSSNLFVSISAAKSVIVTFQLSQNTHWLFKLFVYWLLKIFAFLLKQVSTTHIFMCRFQKLLEQLLHRTSMNSCFWMNFKNFNFISKRLTTCSSRKWIANQKKSSKNMSLRISGHCPLS